MNDDHFDHEVVAEVLGLSDAAVEDTTRTPSNSPVLHTLADVTPEAVSWLWRGRLPLGKLVVLDGDPSVGKSTLAVDWAARVSTGTPWPDGSPCPVGDVIILSAEDGLADTIRPRLDAAGGDPRRVHALSGVTVLDEEHNHIERAVTLADAGVIAAAIRKHSASLLIIDVLMAYLPSGIDSHRDQDIRSVLARIATVADAAGCCVTLLRHLNKTSGGNPLYRGGGSIGIVGAARAAYVAVVDPEDDTGTRRVLACTKNNLAPMPAALVYQLTPADNGMALVTWHGESETSAARLLSVTTSEDERTERDEAVDWLLSYLEHNGGTARAADILKAGRNDGIAERTLKRARERARVRSERRGFGEGAVWTQDPFGPHSSHSGHSGQGPGAGTNVTNGGPNDKQPGLTHLPDRCPQCEYHVPTQGHADGCTLGAVAS